MSSHQRQSQEALFSSQTTVPVLKDNCNYVDRQRNIWNEMNQRMEMRRKEWDDDVLKLKQDFFRLKPEDFASASGVSGLNDTLLEKMDLQNMFYNTKDGSKIFKVSFDVSQFVPEEINVKTQDNKLMVQAKHEEKADGGKVVSREFSRQVDIPSNVDPFSMHSVLSKDGILQVEAPVLSPTSESVSSDIMTPKTTNHPVIPSYKPTQSSPSHKFSPTSGCSVLDNNTCFTIQDGHKMFRITIDIGSDFQPQDLSVKTVDRKLVVNAKHEEKVPGKNCSKEFNKEFDLPELVDPNQVTASLTCEGHLVLEAPMLSPGNNHANQAHTIHPPQ